MTQAELFEPTGADVPRLALHHGRQAESYSRLAGVAKAQGWNACERFYLQQWEAARTEAECLAMLADLERFGGVTQ